MMETIVDRAMWFWLGMVFMYLVAGRCWRKEAGQ